MVFGLGDDFSTLARKLVASAEGAADAEVLALVDRSDKLRVAAAKERARLAMRIESELGPFEPAHLRALSEVRRERFVRARDLPRALEDTPLALDDSGHSTISAPHAYLLSFRLVQLATGDALVELGSGSGYGAALAAEIVGASGSVRTFEIDGALAGRAKALLGGLPHVEVVHGDANDSASAWGSATKVIATFAVRPLPEAWLRAIPIGGVLVAPVGPRDRDQRLVRVERLESGELVSTDHGGVRYVSNRSARAWN